MKNYKSRVLTLAKKHKVKVEGFSTKKSGGLHLSVDPTTSDEAYLSLSEDLARRGWLTPGGEKKFLDRVAKGKGQARAKGGKSPVILKPTNLRGTALSQVKKIEAAILATVKFLQTPKGKELLKSSREKAKIKGSVVNIVLPDMHFHWADPACVSIALLSIAVSQPSKVISLGDLIEAGAFSSHKKKTIKENEGGYIDAEIYTANLFLDAIQEIVPAAELIVLGGNHEARVEAFAASLPGAVAAAVLDGCNPYKLLSRRVDGTQRKNFEVIPYQKALSHYEIAPDLWAIHGWFCGVNFCMDTLRKAAPISMVCGHAHRQQSVSIRNPVNNTIRKVFSPGTLSLLQPLWNAPNPTDWVQGLSLIYIGADKSWTDYTVTIKDEKCVMPGGTQLHAVLR